MHAFARYLVSAADVLGLGHDLLRLAGDSVVLQGLYQVDQYRLAEGLCPLPDRDSLRLRA